MTLDVAEFCSRFGVPPEHVVATETGLRVVGLPDMEADRVIVALLASGLISSYDDDTLDDDPEEETCRYCGGRGEPGDICDSQRRAITCLHMWPEDRDRLRREMFGGDDD